MSPPRCLWQRLLRPYDKRFNVPYQTDNFLICYTFYGEKRTEKRANLNASDDVFPIGLHCVDSSLVEEKHNCSRNRTITASIKTADLIPCSLMSKSVAR